MKKCIHPGCEKVVYYRTALTCDEHRTMTLQCDWCKEEYQLPYNRWLKSKDRIHFCSPSCQTSYHNTTDVMKRASSNRMKAYHNSLSEEERRQRAKELNKLSQTEDHLKALAKHCHEMNQTEEHKEHLLKLNSSVEHAKNSRKTIKKTLDRLWNSSDEDAINFRQKALEALNTTKYDRDEHGNITHIDGIPINDKYKIISNRHWVLPSGEITSKQQKAIVNNGEPICGPRGHLYDNNGNITHIDGVSIEDKYRSIENKSINIDNSFFVLTGRGQNSAFWDGKEAFDQFLVNQGVGWFVYIKFDILGNPLVVGKTGTKMVSNSVNDIVFDYWESNNGPARQYLRDKNLDWDKTRILIVPCNSEQEAFDKEKEIHDKYSLFYS